MSSEPKKVGRRTFLNYAIAVVATGVIVGAATYLAVPKGEVTVTAPGTTITKTVTTTVTGTATTTSPTTTPTTSPKKGSITILAWETTIDDLYRKLIDEDFTPKTGIEVKYEKAPWTTYVSKNLAAISAEKCPYDIISNNTEWTLPAWVHAGKLRPLNDFIEKDFKLDDFLTGFLGVCAYPPGTNLKPTGFYSNFKDAIFYGVPFWADSVVLLYRKDLFDAEGISSPPTNFDKFLDVAKKLTYPDKKIWGYVFTAQEEINSAFDSWFVFIYAWGCNVFDEQLNPAFNNSDGIEATQFFVDLVTKHKVSPESVLAMDFAAVYDFYKAGNAAMMMPWGNTPLGDVPIAKVSRYAPPPAQKRIGSRTAGAAFTIPKSAPNPELAWEYIKWALSPEVRKIAVGELGAPVVLKKELEYMKEGSNAWAVAQTVLRPDVGAMPSIPNLVEISKTISPSLVKALIGQVSVKDALAEAEEKLKPIIAELKGSL